MGDHSVLEIFRTHVNRLVLGTTTDDSHWPLQLPVEKTCDNTVVHAVNSFVFRNTLFCSEIENFVEN